MAPLSVLPPLRLLWPPCGHGPEAVAGGSKAPRFPGPCRRAKHSLPPSPTSHHCVPLPEVPAEASVTVSAHKACDPAAAPGDTCSRSVTRPTPDGRPQGYRSSVRAHSGARPTGALAAVLPGFAACVGEPSPRSWPGILPSALICNVGISPRSSAPPEEGTREPATHSGSPEAQVTACACEWHVGSGGQGHSLVNGVLNLWHLTLVPYGVSGLS